MPKRRDLGLQPKRKRKLKRRNLGEENSKKHRFKIRKPKRRILREFDEYKYWSRKILKALRTPIKEEGGGYLFDQGLFIFKKLTTYKVPRSIINKMVDNDLIKRVENYKHHTYKLVIRRRKL